jgi:hypothetical protein
MATTAVTTAKIGKNARKLKMKNTLTDGMGQI